MVPIAPGTTCLGLLIERPGDLIAFQITHYFWHPAVGEPLTNLFVMWFLELRNPQPMLLSHLHTDLLEAFLLSMPPLPFPCLPSLPPSLPPFI